MNHESIAVVGAGCRLPGDIDSLDDLRSTLLAKRCVVDRVPPDRWDAARFFHPDFKKTGHIHATRGAFLRGVDQFDAGFFGIAPTEARRLDPQQRLVLEASFRALEDAGVPCDSLAGQRVAVIIGCSGRDYDGIQGAASERDRIAGSTNTGSALSIVSNRVSYLFDLRGPSFSVDTACSSSLTAIHCACRAIWNGDADSALAGGVNVILRPEPTIGFSTGGYLSPDGECRAFSDHANGYVRGEGVGVVYLKPLGAALAAGDRIHAVIRSTAVNQDGRTPGMTMPSQRAQEELLATAYAAAGVEPRSVAYMEAHGTGTPAGDPIEAHAIGRVLGRGRDEPLFLGTVKTNLGHLESAAGMAGLFKLMLTLQHRVIFPNLHFRAPNPKIPFDELGIRVPTEVTPLPREGRLFGGVNSFGFGGANAHLVLESPPEPQPVSSHRPGAPVTVFLSARTPEALRSMATEVAERLTSEDEARSLAAALAARSTSFEHRLAASAPGVEGLRAMLASDGEFPGVRRGRARDTRQKPSVAFVFGGQGSQWWGMARTLLRSDALFAATVEEIGALFACFGWQGGEPDALVRELLRDEATSRVSETHIAQPCLFAVQVGLGRRLEASGVRPSAVVGHSIGELGAAVFAGALSLAEAARIVHWRSHTQAAAHDQGLMAALGVGDAEARTLLAPFGGRLEIAAINGPRAVTVAGDAESIKALGDSVERGGGFFRIIDVNVPFHCRLMDPIEGAFREKVGAVDRRDGAVPFYSAVTGGELAGNALDADYWWNNIRQPVLFAGALTSMVNAGMDCFVELGPQPILRRGAEELLEAKGARAIYLPTLKRNACDNASLADCLSALFAAGVRCTPEPAHGPVAWTPLPRHPFARSRHWQESPACEAERTGRGRPAHPHLVSLQRGAKDALTGRAVVRFDSQAEPYLAEHRVQGMVVVPGAAQLEVVAAAAQAAQLGPGAFLEEVEFRLPIFVPAESQSAELYIEIYGDEGHFVVASDNDGAFTTHTRGRINHSGDVMAHPGPFDFDIAASRTLDPDVLYEEARRAGLDLGPSFRAIRSFRACGEETLADIELSEPLAHDAGRHAVHPVLLDAMLQTAALGYLSQEASAGRARGLFLPAGVERFRIHTPHAGGRLRIHARPSPRSGSDLRLDVHAFDDSGAPCVSLQGLLLRGVPGSFSESALRGAAAYEWTWERVDPHPPLPAPGPGTWLLAGSLESFATLASELTARGKCVVTDPRHTDEAPLEGVVFAQPADPSPVAGAIALASLLRDLEGAAKTERFALWVLTCGVFSLRADDPLPAPAGAPLWGFGRVLMTELTDVGTTLVDLPAEPADSDWSSLAGGLLSTPPAAELAVRDGALFRHRLARVAAEPSLPPVDVRRSDVRALVRAPGVVGSVAFAPSLRVEPGPDEIVLRVRAVGLNFKDVVVAMAMLPDKAWKNGMSGAELGMDCAGVVEAVGTNVSEVQVGDEIIALAKSCLGTWAVAHRHHLVRKPAGLSFAEAAALPTAYLTATLALEHVARLGEDETVLIHAGAGGVGIAAIQIAQRIGARIIATTSSESKRSYLHGLGVQHVLGSRSPVFHDEIAALTEGRGVDVVLNSLSGRMLSQGLRSLAPFGRFVEIGKADIYQNRMMSLDVFGENRSFHCLDVNRWAAAQKPHVKKLLHEAVSRIHAGTFLPLPTRAFPIGETAEAFATLAQAKHIGKVAVEIPERGLVPVVVPARFAVRKSGAYLVTGGTRGFGLAVARWLSERGAGHVVLVSRSGAVEDEDAVREMLARGTEVTVRSCAVDDAGATQSLLAEITALTPLRAVFHGAMVLDDAPVRALDAERFERVAAPKITGAWNLHRATLQCELDAFVVFSSVAAVIGTPGQGNYAAANAFLEAFAAYRRGLGLPATCVAFGAIDDVGVVARASAEQRRKILGHGVGALRVGDAIAMLEGALVEDVAHRLAAVVDWSRVEGWAGDRFAHLAGEPPAEAATAGASSRLSVQLADAPAVERVGILADALARLVAHVVGASSPIDLDTSLERVGLDSLSATQLESFIRRELGITLPLVRLLRGPSVRELSTELVASLADRGAPGRISSWVRRLDVASPSARLICFPPMAMHDDAFDGWRALVPSGLEVCSMHLPSLGDLDDGILRGSVDALRERLVAELSPLLDVPFAFYGHSIGGWMALEVAAEIQARMGRTPAFVCLGAVPTPDVLRSIVPAGPLATPEEISDAEVLAALRCLKFPAALLDDVAGRSTIVQAARRDLWLGSRGTLRAQPSHLGDVVVARAIGDELQTLDERGAQDLGLRVAETITVEGGHLFFQESGAKHALLAALGGRLGALCQVGFS